MNFIKSVSLAGLLLLCIPASNFAQAPDLGVATTFSVFTGIGAFNNDGTSMITGDIGTNNGAFAGFPPGTVEGTIHVLDAVSLQASVDVGLAYAQLASLTCDVVLGVGLGNNQTLSPNVYCIGAASTLNGDLILDAQDDPDAIFVFQIDGALSTGANSRVVLINGASLCNVYWQINGAVELGSFSTFLGTLIANGQIEALEGATISGRALATDGAIALHNNVITLGLPPVPSTITANGAITFCAGESVELAGNLDGIWNTGETTPSITVTSSGDYFVTNSTICSSVVSNLTTVTVSPLPTVSVSPETIAFCAGEEVMLAVNASSDGTYLWSTGASTQSIAVTTAGSFSVTFTDVNGCTASATASTTVNALPTVDITADGPTTFCEGSSVSLCASSSSAYLWNTGATGQCITVATSGTYSVTIMDVNDCSSEASIEVTVTPAPTCDITGNFTFCAEGSTELYATTGAASYLWSNGATGQCITVSSAGNYTVTVTDAAGCEATCSQTVTESLLPVCDITGNLTFCEGGSTELCATTGAASYLWSNGATGQCTTVSSAGNYSVTVTDAAGCEATCSQTVTENSAPTCDITGTLTFCGGGSTELCATTGAASYLWSNGATGQCTTVSSAGNYSVTVTDAAGCEATCSQTVTESPAPVCNITGNLSFCGGGSTELCASPGAASYLWSTGATGQCITVNSAGSYAVTVTDASGCVSTCERQVVLEDVFPPAIICPADVAVECGESTLPAATGMATAIDDCSASPIIRFNDAGGSAATCPQIGSIVRTWTATDGSANSSSCVQIVRIEDNTAPTIECPAAITVACSDLVPSVNTLLLEAFDDCDQNVVLTHTGDVITNQVCENTYDLSRTYRATDACGNFSECTQLIRVTDLTPPVISITNALFTNGETITVPCFGQDPTWDLPSYDAGSVTAVDECGEPISIAFTHTLESEGSCAEDGYISLFRLTWTATDNCNNSSSVVLFLALVDTIPPVLIGVPQDITVNCDDIPAIPDFVYATDECLCACIVSFEESFPISSCLDGQVIVRIWTATDRCGNKTIATQNITLVDTVGPQWEIVLPQLQGVADGTVLEYRCESGGIPEYFNWLDAAAVNAPSSCGDAFGLAFETETVFSTDCAADGYVEQRTYRWSGYDACGNQSVFVLVARVVDLKKPQILNVPKSTCWGDPALENIHATDGCTDATLRFWDTNVPNGCGGENIRRTYEAVDACGNTSRATTVLIPNTGSGPVLSLIGIDLTDWNPGDTLQLEGIPTPGQYTYFSVDNLSVENACNSLTLAFSETIVSAGDCARNEAALIELEWTATDRCGNSSVLKIMAAMTDVSGPEFTNFAAVITIGCIDTLPTFYAVADSGEVTIVFKDSIIDGTCEFAYVVQRSITATDLCGNVTTLQQVIHVGNGEGPTIEGLEAIICDDLSIPEVNAYDACAGVFVPVTMQQDTLESRCEGVVVRRTWTAVNSCGNITQQSQVILLDDEVEPRIHLPGSSVLRSYEAYETHWVSLGQWSEIEALNALGANSVIVVDNCDQASTAVFSLVISYPEDCQSAGYVEQRLYTWVASDVCGNAMRFYFTINIVDDVAPVLLGVPSDLTITCAPLPPVAEVFAADTLDLGPVAYSQTIEDGAEAGVFIVTRTWTLTDACGNTTESVQTITWVPDTFLECNIILPEDVACNSHGVIVRSGITGAVSYDWEIVGEECFIQQGQNTPEITIYVGWSTVKIILTVTDAFGCTSMCMVFLDCNSIYALDPTETSGDAALGQIALDGITEASTETLQNFTLLPNPARDNVSLQFDAPAEADVAIRLVTAYGVLVFQDKIRAQKGTNTYQVNSSQLPKGSYLAQISTDQGVLTKALIIL
ncbi:ice-binding family protein [Neolewinella lacunae]|uniref:DUF3494 domain-containing protein n=1 Tax=Neolewinella lacunae TaxID=1517758 RepID=A0A923T8J1_9BACT|nr:ice-binding family protein [Neolewinella lacunae]MBC6995680.1 DUF3494 domain-containing protein [Neolewinella lacunae]MDN3636627.1 ice-binding family protein [Neolewinella lacunae]